MLVKIHEVNKSAEEQEENDGKFEKIKVSPKLNKNNNKFRQKQDKVAHIKKLSWITIEQEDNYLYMEELH